MGEVLRGSSPDGRFPAGVVARPTQALWLAVLLRRHDPSLQQAVVSSYDEWGSGLVFPHLGRWPGVTVVYEGQAVVQGSSSASE